jgi:DNA-binding protein H-NS
MIFCPFALVGRNSIMARTANLTNMNVAQLLDLRKQIDATLVQRRGELEKQLRVLGTATDGVRRGRGRSGVSPLAGIKVAPKYRGPEAQTWAGRGQRPKWLAEATKAGQSPEDFLIEKTPAVGKKKRRAKR